MDRVSNLAANSHLVTVIGRNRLRVEESQIQISTGKTSQDYAGIAIQSERLITLETTRTALIRFGTNNNAIKGRLDVLDQALTYIDKTIRDFRGILNEYGGQTPIDESSSRTMQNWAFRALNEIESQLNTRVDGRYLLGGSQATTPPFELGAKTLDEFQAHFDGRRVTFPETRQAHLESFSLSADAGGASSWLTFEEPSDGPSLIRSTTASFGHVSVGTTIEVSGTPGGLNDGFFTVEAVPDDATLQVKAIKLIDEGASGSPASAALEAIDGTELGTSVTGGLAFDGAANTITAETPGSLTALKVGSVFRITGSTNNAGTFRVASNDGTTITIAADKLAPQGGGGLPVTGTISAASGFKGDDADTHYRLDNDHALDLRITALDPSFEKAIRAMAIIAQGAPKTEGGLADHSERVGDAIALLTAAIDRAPAVAMPYGEEASDNLEDLRMHLGFSQVVVDETVTRHRELIASLDSGIASIENVEPTEAISRFLNDTQALEASLKALSRIRELSLVQYL